MELAFVPRGMIVRPVWQIWVDTGGTFTDCVALDPQGQLHRAKVLSTGCLRGRVVDVLGPQRLRLQGSWSVPDAFFRGASLRLLADPTTEFSILGSEGASNILELSATVPDAVAGAGCEISFGEEAPLLGARLATRTPFEQSLPPVAMRLGTTRGTNALLERRGVPTALFITSGFGDLLEIGNQQRPELFSLEVRKPPPLHAAVVEVKERLAADGEVLRAPDLKALRRDASQLLEQGVRVAAVALLHSYVDSRHEDKVAEVLEELGFDHVSRSSALASRIRILPRAETAVVNAYLAEAIEAYMREIEAELKGGSLHGLTSAGGLSRGKGFLPKDSLLSGPAGGVVGAALAGRRSGFVHILAFDMGGTSTDVSRYDGEYDYLFESRVGDARILTPSLAIETVAAGGGSICLFDGRQLKVGPESAGADPGPACYGAGGPLSLTDVNLLLGRLDPLRFEIPIDPSAAEVALNGVLERVLENGRHAISTEELLQGFLDIANERMAEAVRRVSIRRGYRPADYLLVAFGGAGGQHACALAGILDIDKVLLPADAGLLSAFGLGYARVERFAERQVLRSLEESSGQLPGLVDQLEEEAIAAVTAEGVSPEAVEIRRRQVNLRLVGQETALEVPWSTADSLIDDFAATYEDHYGYRPEPRPIEVESVRVVAAAQQALVEPHPDTGSTHRVEPGFTQPALFGGEWMEMGVFDRRELDPGSELTGPAVVFERHSAAVVEPGWQGRVDEAGGLVLSRSHQGRRRE